MTGQLSTNADALRLFFTEDIYLIRESGQMEEMNDDLTQESNPQIVSKEALRSFEYLGKNKRNILLLVNDSENDVSTEKGNELLRNIVKAIRLTANDFALVNYAKYPDAKYSELNAFFSNRVMFSFGVSAQELGLVLQPFNEVVQMEDTSLIFCHDLDQLSGDQQGKKMLWNSLKQLAL